MNNTSRNEYETKALSRKANEMRGNVLEMAISAGGGHIGGSFSSIDILSALYFRVLNHDPENPDWAARDRFIFSKGHSCLAFYTVLAECGYFPKEELKRYCTDGGALAGHPERDLVPGAEATTGSLGHGLPIAVGMAISAKLNGEAHRTVCLLGDGECNEGSVWEALMAGAQYKLKNLTAIIDSNKYESLGTVEEILSIEPLGERLSNFGWFVREIDGHDMDQIVDSLETPPNENDKPSAIVAHTVKGKGVSFMENVSMWHYRGPTEDEAEKARAELKALLHS